MGQRTDDTFEASWLCETPLSRTRILDLDRQLGAAANATTFILPASFLLTALVSGPWALVPLLPGPCSAWPTT